MFSTRSREPAKSLPPRQSLAFLSLPCSTPPPQSSPPTAQSKSPLQRRATMPAAMPNLLFLLLLFLSLAATSTCSHSQSQVQDAEPQAAEMVPMVTASAAGYSGVVMNETRRRLGRFQLCAPCTCCGGPRGVCVLAPCCYAINCNIPNRPFGFCSFTPKSCDCLGCNL